MFKYIGKLFKIMLKRNYVKSGDKCGYEMEIFPPPSKIIQNIRPEFIIGLQSKKQNHMPYSQ